MKKILFLLLVVVLCSCGSEKTNDESNDMSDYCGCEVLAKMTNGSAINSEYYFCLKDIDTVFYNINVPKKIYQRYEIGDVIQCENDNYNLTDNFEGNFYVVKIGNHQYLIAEKCFYSGEYTISMCHYEDCEYCLGKNSKIEDK